MSEEKQRKKPLGKGALRTRKAKRKIKKVLDEFKAGTLRSGSKTGPQVKSREQAVAIALSEARKRKKKK